MSALVGSYPSKERLREFIRDHYGDSPPALVWVSSATDPDEGVDYRYADGSIINEHRGRYTWYAPDTSAAEGYAALRRTLGTWDPAR